MDGLITRVAGRRHVRKTGPKSLTLEKRRAFLDALALTCNVVAAARFADLAASTVHHLRRNDAAFATQWQAALEIGYDRLEALALEHSGAGVPIEPDPDRAAQAGADPAPFDFDKAMRLLMFHRASRQGQRVTNADDVRQVMIEGPSGVMRVARQDEPLSWRAINGEVRWPNGSVATVYSAEAPERLRGPEHDAAWCDELAKWRLGEATWDNLMMTMRIGDTPRVVVTTTPRTTNLMRRVRALKDMVETTGCTHDNEHLPGSFVAAMNDTYGGTRLGRQELNGEMIDDVAGALWTRDRLEECRVALCPELVRVVVAVDPPAGIGHDACGIVVVALGADGCDPACEGERREGAERAGYGDRGDDPACFRDVGAGRCLADRAAADDRGRRNRAGMAARGIALQPGRRRDLDCGGRNGGGGDGG